MMETPSLNSEAAAEAFLKTIAAEPRRALAPEASPRRRRRSVLEPALYPGARPGGAFDERAAAASRAAGNASYARGDYAAALDSYSACVLRNPGDHVAYSNRSACFLRLERPEDAFDDAERCLWLAPGYAKGYLRRGGAEWRLNRRADARATYERGLATAPDCARLREVLAEIAGRDDASPAGAARAALCVRRCRVFEAPDRARSVPGSDSFWETWRSPFLHEISKRESNISRPSSGAS